MTKKKKFVACVVVYVTMLAVAITVGFFICKNNLEKQFAPPVVQEGEVMLQYETEGDAPTKTTVIFDTAAKTCKVSFLASSMYQGEYSVAYAVENNLLMIDTASQIDATDVSGIASLIGLPAVMTADITHQITVGDGELLLKIIFSEDVVLFDVAIDAEKLTELGIDATKLIAVAPTGVILNSTELTLEAGATEKLIATIQPENALAGTFVWTSSDEAVATVSEDGTVTAVAEGTAVITVTAVDGAVRATCSVSVTAKEPVDVPAGDVVLEYTGEGDTPTVTTLTFHVGDGTVDVVSCASGLYDLSYQTTYIISDGVLILTNVKDLTAVMLEAMQPVFGAFLPVEMSGNAIHSFADGVLTIYYGTEDNLAEAAVLGTFTIDADTLAVLDSGAGAPPAGNVLTYTGEGDTPTVTTVTFDVESGKARIESVASGLYVLNYDTDFTVSGGVLTLTNVEDLTAVMIEEMQPVFGAFLPVEMPGNAIHSIADGVLTIYFGTEDNLAEAAVLGTFTLTPEQLGLLGI